MKDLFKMNVNDSSVLTIIQNKKERFGLTARQGLYYIVSGRKGLQDPWPKLVAVGVKFKSKYCCCYVSIRKTLIEPRPDIKVALSLCIHHK